VVVSRCFFVFKRKTAYELFTGLEFRRVLFRSMQAHYRSELEFSWDNLIAALTRLKRIVMGVERLQERLATAQDAKAPHPKIAEIRDQLNAAISNDLNSPPVIPLLEELLSLKKIDAAQRMDLLQEIDLLLGLNLEKLTRVELRLPPKSVSISETEIEQKLDMRQQSKIAKDFAAADAIRDDLMAQGVELMDGDPLRWEWSIKI